MVTVISGRSGTGKTSEIIRRIGVLGQNGFSSVLVVPEQYSHDAERLLCASLGAEACLYTETLSFSRLYNRILSEGGRDIKILSKGGRLLCMRLAFESCVSHLTFYNSASQKPDILKTFVETYDSFKSAGINLKDLYAFSQIIGGELAQKLSDFALLFEMYETIIPDDLVDPIQLASIAADLLNSSSFCNKTFFFDGFSDFTAQEKLLIETLIQRKQDTIFCLNCDGIFKNDGGIFLKTCTTGRMLSRLAEDNHCNFLEEHSEKDGRNRPDILRYLDTHLFDFQPVTIENAGDSVQIFRAETVTEECELAAGLIRQLVIDNGYRWKDISVVAPDWKKYSVICNGIFDKYEIPFMQSVKRDILEKPVIALLLYALEVVRNDWKISSVFKMLKTGLLDLSEDDCDILENYVLKWNISGKMRWCSDKDWDRNPNGFSETLSDNDRLKLNRINAVRRTVVNGVSYLEKAMSAADNAKGKAMALYDFSVEINLPEKLSHLAEGYRQMGMLQLADETVQVWDILIDTLEQMAAILKDDTMDTDAFAALLKLILSQSEIGTIPVSLDCVGTGDMNRMKRRDLKCLILLGATNTALPAVSTSKGLLSEDDLDSLAAIGASVGESTEELLQRAMYDIYTTLTLPSEKLYVSYSSSEDNKPAFFISTLCAMTGKSSLGYDHNFLTYSKSTAMQGLIAGMPNVKIQKQLVGYFKEDAELWSKIESACRSEYLKKNNISRLAVNKLYGRRLNMTASRIEKFVSCPMSFALAYGLKAQERKPAKMDAPEIGTFMHYVLENVVRDSTAMGGLGSMSEEACRKLTDQYISRYISSVLHDFKEQSERFRYLFMRQAEDIQRIVWDMAQELAVSDFKPTDFELSFDFSDGLPPEIIEANEFSFSITGKVDRVDLWDAGDALYLRVIDYKTGNKDFNLSDVWYGLGMQMLIYLFMLERCGDSRYGKKPTAAGVLYSPARDKFVPVEYGQSESDVDRMKQESVRRKGVVLNDAVVVDAMEHGDSKRFIPVTVNKDGTLSEKNKNNVLLDSEQLNTLNHFIENKLLEIGKQIVSGDIKPNPGYTKDPSNACGYCPYKSVCSVNDEACGPQKRHLKQLSREEAWALIEGSGHVG